MIRAGIRVDASHAQGIGHVMRCLTLANGLRKLGAEVLFICRTQGGHQCEVIEEQGFAVERLAPEELPPLASPNGSGQRSAVGDAWAADAEATRRAIERFAGVDWLVVDHYALGADWEAEAGLAASKVMAIDDLADRQHRCDVLLDQNLHPGAADRYKGLVPTTCVTLLGPAYALLREEFIRARERLPQRKGPARSVLISFGGSDSGNETERAVRAFLAVASEDARASVVVGSLHPQRSAIEDLCRGDRRLELHYGTTRMAELMSRSDLAIGAGGVTAWERCALGLPSLVITIASNQKLVAESLSGTGCITLLGSSETLTQRSIEKALARAMSGAADLGGQSERCLALVDASGVKRVIRAMNALLPPGISLRRAELEDMQRYLEWANDPEVRRGALNGSRIETLEHEEWFLARVNSDSTQLWIAETPARVPIGQVRFDDAGEGWRLSYSIAADFRGLGLATPMLKAAVGKLADAISPRRIFAEVKTSNIPSRRALESAGFALHRHVTDSVDRLEFHADLGRGGCD